MNESLEPEAWTLDGGADSLEVLLSTWYQLSESGEPGSISGLILSDSHAAELYDCSAEGSQDHLMSKRLELRRLLESENQRRVQAYRETGSTIEVERASIIRSMDSEVGEESEGCVLKHPLRWHTVRVSLQERLSSGQTQCELHRGGILEVGGRWFLRGVPGSLVRSEGAQPALPAPNPQSLDSVVPIRLRNRARVRPAARVSLKEGAQ